GFGGSSIPYKEFKDEHGLTSEEVKMEPVIFYNCAYCEYRSSIQKGLRSHRLTSHKIGVGTRRTLDAHGHPSPILDRLPPPPPLTILVTQKGCHRTLAFWTTKLHQSLLFSGCLNHKFSHMSRGLNTIKSTYNAALKWLLGLQSYISHCSSVAAWNTNLVTPKCRDPIIFPFSTALQWLHGLQVWSYQSLLFRGCLDYKFSHMRRCLDTIKSTLNAALQWLFGLKV
ncbi:uncharacterized protein TNIN_132281, partial [Trichonephila inaurata madagascariensis]